MPEMKDSRIEWISGIPAEWNSKPIRYLFRHVTEKNIFGNEKTALKFTYGTIIPKSDFDADTDDYVANTILNYTLVRPGVIMINCLNLNYDFVSQRIGLVKDKGAITSAYLAIEPKKDVDSEYANYQLKYFDSIKAFHNMGTGVRKTLDFSELGKKYFILPSKTVQRKIVAYLNRKCAEIDSLHADIEKQIDVLEQYKKSVITEAVTKGLDPNAEMKDSGIEWIGKIPKDWKQCKIKNVCLLIGSGTTPKSNVEDYYVNGSVPWIQSGDLYNKTFIKDVSVKITELGFNSAGSLCLYKAPFVVIAMYGASVGNACISLINACTNQACCVLKTNSEVCLKYLFYWIKFCKDNFIGSAIGGSQPNISQDKIKNQLFFIFDLNEQQQIADYLDFKCAEIDSAIADKKKQLETLEAYKKSLIYEYVTGKKEVSA